jgi:histidine kinase
MLAKLRERLVWKLLAAYILVILVGVLVWAIAVELVVPTVFDRHMGGTAPMMDMGSGMAGGSDLFTNFQAAMNEVLLWGAGASILAALITAWWLSRQLVAPIQDMTRASQRIAGGQFEQRVAAPAPGNQADELGQLAHNFNRMAAQLQEIEAMRLQLIGDVSHELRTPLTSIKGSMEGLIDGVLPSTPETFQSVHREADRLQRLVDDLQELSRAEAGAYPINPEPLPVAQLLHTVQQRFAPQFEGQGVALVIDPPAEDGVVLADRDRTIQVLTNLVGNALQYTPENGTVRVAAKVRQEEVEFTVEDTGTGIASEHLPHLFQRFYRADKSRSRASGGSGIGLTIARHLVEAQGGQIEAKSAGPGQGATFRFTLPKAS